MPLVIGTINITAGIITTIYQFLKVSELVEAHKQAHYQYSKFARNIETELSQIKEDRSVGGTFFLKQKQEAFDGFIESSPIIPKRVLKEFMKTFGRTKKCETNDNNYELSKCDRCYNLCYVCWVGFWCCKGCKKCCDIACNKYDPSEEVIDNNQNKSKKIIANAPNT